VRDIMGVSARPIANTDVLCFGPLDTDPADLDNGVLHPRRIYNGVVHGVEDYGNKMGIPTVNGAIYFHPGYTANPLVYCGCAGIAPVGTHVREARPGDLVVVLGGRTGRDGLHGATFSSIELTDATGVTSGGAVQIGNPVVEKMTLDALLRARDARLYTAITDCGAGGLSSAVSEMGSDTGARVDLDKVTLKYQGLSPWEIWLSEAQERMVIAVPPGNEAALRAICDEHSVEMTAIGEFTGDGRLKLQYGGEIVADLSMAFLHGGIPRRHLDAE
jgi:phosphoribosylformylglycinamidine synthase